MRRLLTIVFLYILIIPHSTIYAENSDPVVAVYVKGDRLVLEQEALIESGTTLVPFRPVFQKLGFSVTFDKETQTVTAIKNETKIIFSIGNKTGIVNGEKTEMSIAPKLINYTTYVPLRFISDATGNSISYDKEFAAVQVGAYYQLDNYFKMSWGLSPQDIKKLEKRELISEGEEFLTGKYELKYSGMIDGTSKFEGTISYLFTDNKLDEVYIYPKTEDNFEDVYYTYLNVYFDLDDLHFKTDSSQLLWADDVDRYEIDAYWEVYDNDFTRMIYMAMLSDDLSLSANFTSDLSNYNVFMANSGSFSNPKFFTIINITPN